MALNLAIYGYDTEIGENFINLLNEDESLEFDTIYPLTPFNDIDGLKVKDELYECFNVDSFDFNRVDVVLLLCTKDETFRLSEKILQSNATILDCSDYFYENKVDVNYKERVIAVPKANVYALSLLFANIHENFAIKNANINLLMSLSNFGINGIMTLAKETRSLLNAQSIEDNETFKAQVAFNVQSAIGLLDENSYSSHENKIYEELVQKLPFMLGKLDLTSVLVPVFYGDTINVHVNFEDNVGIEEFKDMLCDLDDSFTFVEDDEFCTTMTHACAEDKIIISRLRSSRTSSNSFDFIIMLDNLKLQAINIIKILKFIAK